MNFQQELNAAEMALQQQREDNKRYFNAFSIRHPNGSSIVSNLRCV